MADVLDVERIIDGDDDEPAPSTNGTAFVCDYVGPEGVCGEAFTEARYLGAHKYHKHGVKGSSDRAKENRGKGRASADKKPRRTTTTKPAAEKAADRAAGPSTDRAAIYTASLSMAALAAYFGIPPFNQTDLDICNAGVPNVGRALAQLADHNPSVARACDLILGGGGGGDYIALIMAVVPIAGAIAANHGYVPATSGQRFGEMIGVVPAAPVPTSATESPPPASSGPDIDVIAHYTGTPETVMTDARSKMMSMGGAIPVVVPMSMTPTENPDGERGSEQLRPVEATADAPAEQESGAAVPA